MTATRITLQRDATELPGWIDAPDEGRRPAVLIVPSIFGSDDGTRSLLAAFTALAGPVGLPDLFARTDPGPAGFGDAGRSKAFARMKAYDRETGLADLAVWAAHLRAHPRCDGHVLTFGICFGGHLAVLLSSTGSAEAVVTVHGGGIDEVVASGAPLLAPMHLHFGDSDGSIPVAVVEGLREHFAARDDVQVTLHAGADHGFGHPGSPNFVPSASAAAHASVRTLVGALAAG